MSSCDESNISKNYIIQTPTDFDILSACTGFYTNNIYNCTGDTLTLHSTTVSANTINASVYLSGGTNLLDIFGSLDNYTTGATLVGSVAWFDRTNALSAYTLDLSALTDNNTFVTGNTLSGNTLLLTRNDGVVLPNDISSIIPSSDLGDILFVATTGDDSTGTKGDINKPYRNLYAAKSASTSGDTVYVFPGTWTYDNRDSAGKPFNGNIETLVNLWKDGVNYYFSPNSKVVFLNQGGFIGAGAGDRMYLFRPPLTQYETCNVYGKLDFETSTFCCNNTGGYGLLFESGEHSTVYSDGYSCNLEFNTAISNANQAIQIGVSTSATSISYLNIVADTITVNYVEGQSGNGGAISVISDGKFEGSIKLNNLNSWLHGFYNKTYTTFGNSSDFKLIVDIDTIDAPNSIIHTGFKGDSFYNISNVLLDNILIHVAAVSNGTTTINANVYGNNGSSTAAILDLLPSSACTTIFNGNIFPRLTSGIGRKIINSTTNNNTIIFNGNVFYEGTGSTTENLFDISEGNLNLECLVDGSFGGKIINNRNANVVVSNSNFNSTVTGATLFGNDVTGSTGTTSIRNSTFILDNSTTDLCDGQYLNTYILNSNIKNRGTSDIFTNSTNTGLLQIHNSSLVSNGVNTINISGNSPLTLSNVNTNTNFNANNVSGTITEITELDIE
jgi:hypothetical protein